jgi:multiple sugar transport system substrate-binding protein
MKKVITTITILLVGMAFFLTSCGGGSDAAATIPAYDPEQNYEVSLGLYGDLEAAYTAVFASDDFKEKFPNVTITYQTSDFGGHHNRLTTVLAANEATNDIEALEVGFIAAFVEGGGLTDLSADPFNGISVGRDLVDFAMSNATTRTAHWSPCRLISHLRLCSIAKAFWKLPA